MNISKSIRFIIYIFFSCLSISSCNTDEESYIEVNIKNNQIYDAKQDTSKIENGRYYTTTQDIDNTYRNRVFRNITFNGGVKIFNTNNIKFINCTFTNPRGYGVRFRKELDSDDTSNISFNDCNFLGARYDNVNISRDDIIADRVLHKNVKFEGCYFQGWAQNGTTVSNIANRGFYHAIYAKCPNVTIKDCEFNNTVYNAGHMINIRSSARVVSCTFKWSEEGNNAISYSPKDLKGTPDTGWNTVIIQNNLMYTSMQNNRAGVIHLETQTRENININNLMNSIDIKFNTIVLLPGGISDDTYVSAIRINSVLKRAYVSIYANLLVDGRNKPVRANIIKDKSFVDYLSNNLETTRLDQNFINWQANNFRLKNTAPARGFCNDEPRYIVPLDLLGNPRRSGKADAGCYMY